MNQKKAGVLLSYGQITVMMLSNLLYTPIMLRMLGQSEYGVYSLSSSVIGYFALLYAGMSSTYLRYYSSYQAKGDEAGIAKLNGLFLILFSGMGLLALVLGMAMSFNLKVVLGSGLTEAEFSLARILFVIMSVNMALLMPKTVFATLVISQERFVFIKSLGVVTAICSPVLNLLLLYQGYGSVGMSIVVLAVTTADLLVNIWYCHFKLRCRFDFRKLPFYLLPGMLSFSVFLVLQGIMDQLNWHLGKILLSYVADSVAIAVYSVGLQIDLLFGSMSSAFYGVVVPQIYRLVQEQKLEELTQLWIKVGRYQFYVLFFIWAAFMTFGQSFIQLWAGYGYDDAYWVAVILMTPIVIHLCQVMGMEVLRAYNKHAQWVLVHLLFAGLGFVLCIPLAKWYGAIGVAIGTCVNSFLVTNIYDNWYYYKAGKLDVFRFFRNFSGFLPAVLAVLLSVNILSYLFPVNSWFDFTAVMMCFTLLYCVIMYTLGMNSSERMQVKKIMRRGSF